MRPGLCALLLVLSLLGAARASPAATVEPHPAATSWSGQLHRSMGHDLVGWTVAGAGFGALQVGLWTAIPFRASYSGDLALGNALVLAPLVAGALATAGIRRSLRTGPSLDAFRRRLEVHQAVFGVVALALWTPVGVLAGVAMVFAPAAGLALLAFPTTATVLSAVFAGYRGSARRLASGERRPPARLLAAGPTGIVVAF